MPAYSLRFWKGAGRTRESETWWASLRVSRLRLSVSSHSCPTLSSGFAGSGTRLRSQEVEVGGFVETNIHLTLRNSSESDTALSCRGVSGGSRVGCGNQRRSIGCGRLCDQWWGYGVRARDCAGWGPARPSLGWPLVPVSVPIRLDVLRRRDLARIWWRWGRQPAWRRRRSRPWRLTRFRKSRL